MEQVSCEASSEQTPGNTNENKHATRHHFWMVATAALFCLICFGPNLWYWVGPASWGPRITCDAPVADFGKAPNSEIVEVSFRLQNTGRKDLAITEIRPGCSCLTPPLENTTLQPGEEVRIPVQVSLRGKQGMVQEQLVIYSNDPQRPHLFLAVQGNATP